jgi:hypothetical protein
MINIDSPLAFLTNEFELLKLRFYVQLQEDTQLPAFKGSMLHGLLGHALKAVNEKAFFVLYGDHEQQQPKPYMVCPNEDLKTHWHKGEIYYFDIVLFGKATQISQSVVDAMVYGQKLGLGGRRCKYTLTSVCSVLPTKIASGIHKTTLAEWLQLAPIDFNEIENEIAIHFKTPIRVKSGGKIVKNKAPSLNEWVNHILRRLIQISRYWVVDNDDLFESLYDNRPNLGDYEVTQHVYFEDWQRYSLKDRQSLPFGGLQGQVSYFGDVQAALPWLKLGQLLHLGGKTTFGLGAYQLIT